MTQTEQYLVELLEKAEDATRPHLSFKEARENWEILRLAVERTRYYVTKQKGFLDKRRREEG